jgi:hypothetical protein
VAVEPALVHHQRAVSARHAGEHALGHRTAGNREARLRMLAEQVVEQSRGQDRIAQPGRGDEEDSHGGAAVARL